MTIAAMARVPTISFEGAKLAITISLTKLAVRPRITIMLITCMTRTARKVALKGAAP